MLKALFRKIGIFFKNLFMGFLNLFSKKTSSSPALEVQIQQVNTTTLDDTEEETQPTREKIKTILQKTNIALDENKREQLIEEAYNPESLLDGIKELKSADLLSAANLDIILSKIGKWDAARTIVALHKEKLLDYLKLALEKFPHYYRAQIIINLHHAGLTTDLEFLNSSNTKEISRPIMILSRNNLLTQANLGSILDNQGVFLSPNISLLWERFCLSLSNSHPYSLSQEQFDMIISLCKDYRNTENKDKMSLLEIFIRKNIFREQITPKISSNPTILFRAPSTCDNSQMTIENEISP